MPQRLGVNVDHVATLRQARRTTYPDPVTAAAIAELAGAAQITIHLREDRRHIQERDLRVLRQTVQTLLNLEMAATPGMLAIALDLRPRQVTLVPERREEVTTEGGLDVTRHPDELARMLRELSDGGIRTSLFIDPELDAVTRSLDLGADAVELHTGRYAHHPGDTHTLAALAGAARHGTDLGIAVHAGHGLTIGNVRPIASIPGIEELNIGHSIVSRAIFVGLAEAVREMRRAIG